MESLLNLLVLEEILSAGGSLQQIFLSAVLHLPMLSLLLVLELLLNMGYHFCQFLHRHVLGLVFALSLGGGFVIALLALHEDDVLVGLFGVFGVAFSVEQLELFFRRGGELRLVGLAIVVDLVGIKLSFLHRNYIDFKLH